MQVHSSNSFRSHSVIKRYGLRSRQRGIAPGYEGIFALIFIGIGLLFLIVYGVAIGLGKTPKEKRNGFLIATVLLSPFWFPVLKLGVEQKWWDITRSVSEELCYKELESFPKAIAIESLVDETGGLNFSNIVHLLTTTKLRSIDIKLGITGYANYSWSAAQQHGFAHLELGASSEAHCFYPDGSDKDNFFTAAPPIKPGTCLQVSYLDKPAGRYVVRETRSGIGNRYSTWIIQDRESNKTLASVTDALRLSPYSKPVPHWEFGHADRCITGVGGYGLLLDLVVATKESAMKANQWTLTKSDLIVNGIPQGADQVKPLRDGGLLKPLNSTDKPFDGDHNALNERPTWAESYAVAKKQGAWMFDNQLVIPNTDEVFNVSSKGYGRWGTTGSQLVFITGYQSERQITVFGADFQGNLLWTAQTAPLTPWTTSSNLQFEPRRFELTSTDLLIHGIYGHSIGEENRKPWTISIPLSELSSLEVVPKSNNRLSIN